MQHLAFARLTTARLYNSFVVVRPLHSVVPMRQKGQPTPDIYLKNDGHANGRPGLNEDENSGYKVSATARKYVAASQLSSEARYDVPSGAYHTSNPLESLKEVERPTQGVPSSTSPDYAHPITTNAVARVEDGIGSSASVRFRNAPGKMEKGGYGGAKLSDGIHSTENKLPDRNPQPQAEFGRQGIDEAWKNRK